MKKLKVLLVDSSVLVRMAVLDMVNSIECSVIERTASNGSIALEWLTHSDMDVVLIDVMIIKKEGLDLIKRMKISSPEVEIIVMSSNHPESPVITLESLKAGAMDFIQKPGENEFEKHRSELRSQFNTLFMQILIKKFTEVSESSEPAEIKKPMTNKDISKVFLEQRLEDNHGSKWEAWGNIDLILIASSTGGPVALDIILSTFPVEFRKPVLIVQHMPPEFTHIMAQTLDKKYHLNISEGKDNRLLKDGEIIIAPGGMHMSVVEADGFEKAVRLLDTDFVNGVKPSADVLFQSIAATYEGKNILAVILTGMGNDGTRGITELKRSCNCYCITQSESTCVVYGMPKCVFEAGLSDEVVDLQDISFRIRQIVLKREGGTPGGESNDL